MWLHKGSGEGLLRMWNGLLWMALALVCPAALLHGQTPSADYQQALVSPSQYVNVNLGFSVPLPSGCEANRLSEVEVARIAFSCQMSHHGLTVVVVGVKPARADQTPREALPDAGWKRERREIGGHEFWSQAGASTTPAGVNAEYFLITRVQDQLVTVSVQSFDRDALARIKASFDQIAFFHPAEAAERAGADPQPYPAGRSDRALAGLASGTLADGVYRNKQLGLWASVPQGWTAVDAARQREIIEARHREAAGGETAADAAGSAAPQDPQRCSKNLVWLTRSEVGAAVVSSYVLQAFDLQCLPEMRFPASVDDRQALADAVDLMKTMAARTSGAGVQIRDARSFTLGTHLVLQITFQATDPASGAMAFGCIRMALARSFLVAWLLSAPSDAELGQMERSDLHFDP